MLSRGFVSGDHQRWGLWDAQHNLREGVFFGGKFEWKSGTTLGGGFDSTAFSFRNFGFQKSSLEYRISYLTKVSENTKELFVECFMDFAMTSPRSYALVTGTFSYTIKTI